MRILNTKIFDDVIAGTTATWLSRAEFNSMMGQADGFAIQAVTTGISGTLPTLTVKSEHSCDSQNWILTPQTEINAVSIVENGSLIGFTDFFVLTVVAANLRFRVSLGGTNPSCRLKLYFTGRIFPF